MMFWSELRATEGGRIVVCSWSKNQSEVISWTPKGFNARTSVHEYGGGSIFVHKGHVYFSNFDDQRMYKQESPMSTPQPLTPEGKGLRYDIRVFMHVTISCICYACFIGWLYGKFLNILILIFRYADGEMCEPVKKIICVREDHGVVKSGEAKEARNTIVSIDPETQEQFILVIYTGIICKSRAWQVRGSDPPVNFCKTCG